MHALELASLHRQLGIPVDYARTCGLTLQTEADESQLVSILTDGARDIRLLKPAAIAWIKMRDAAARSGVTLLPLSGFRSVSRQTQILRQKVAANQTMEEILTVNAAPGYSEHHTGRAIDLGTPGSPPLECCFETTGAFRWLSEEAERFNFTLSYPRNQSVAIGYEPWHWCWSSDQTARRFHAIR